MRIRARRHLRGTTIACALLGLGACGTASVVAEDAPAAPSAAPEQTYALFPGKVPGPGWEINSAARLGDPESQDLLDELPDIAWSAEYEDFSDGESETGPFIKMYGFDHGLGPQASGVSEQTVPTKGGVAGHPAMWGTDPADPEGETFVALSFWPGHTVEPHAFNVAVDDLRRFAGTLRPASQADWTAAHRPFLTG